MIPSNASEHISAFLQAGKTGEITMQVKDGRILQLVIKESMKM